MRFCDLTYTYTPTSGGIRTYINQKRRYLLEHTEHEHVLIVPGEKDAVERDGRSTTYRIASPKVPGYGSYRFFWRPGVVRDALREARPDVLELGSFYICPWAAFAYRKWAADQGHRCLVSGFFHTDIPKAYVKEPVGAALGDGLGEWSETLGGLGMKVADLLEMTAAQFLSKVFERCDVVIASTPKEAERLKELSVADPKLVPLGADTAMFHPGKRDASVREAWGAAEGEPVLIFAGRFDHEKRAAVVVDAFERLPEEMKAHLVLVGDGPKREVFAEKAEATDRLHLMPYESDRAGLAKLLASADVYVSAGPHETFGLSVIEAQACGLPVVGVEAGALRERVDDTRGRLVPVDDAAAFAEAVAEVWQLHETLGKNARQHVVDHFTWESSFAEMARMYSAALAGLRAGAGSVADEPKAKPWTT